MKFLSNLTDAHLKEWAHDNALSIFMITVINAVGWVITVLQCH